MKIVSNDGLEVLPSFEGFGLIKNIVGCLWVSLIGQHTKLLVKTIVYCSIVIDCIEIHAIRTEIMAEKIISKTLKTFFIFPLE